jgi:hypothetical protein
MNEIPSAASRETAASGTSVYPSEYVLNAKRPAKKPIAFRSNSKLGKRILAKVRV